MKDLLREMFFGFVAIASFLEMIGGGLFSLFFAVERTMEVLGITDESLAFMHLTMVLFWNVIIGSGASMVFYTLNHPEKIKLGRWGVVIATVGLLGYGSYRFWFATTYLLAYKDYMQVISVVYLLIAVATLLVGRDLFRADWQPEQPVQRDPYETIPRSL